MNIEFTSQICTTKEQSVRLLALGLNKETADMTYFNDNICSAAYNEMECPYDNLVHPAWSLHRLIEMMPNVITYDDYQLILGVNTKCVYYADNEYGETFKDFEGNLYECVVKCIEWLIKEGYFNKNY